MSNSVIVLSSLLATLCFGCTSKPAENNNDISTAAPDHDVDEPAPDGAEPAADPAPGKVETKTGTLFHYPEQNLFSLCGSVATSMPPRCGPPSVTLIGVDSSALPPMTTKRGPGFIDQATGQPVDGQLISWSNAVVTVTGSLDGDQFRVTDLK